jgi:hypothetical protein
VPPELEAGFIDPAWAVSASQRFEIRDVHYKVRMRVFKFAQAGSVKAAGPIDARRLAG